MTYFYKDENEPIMNSKQLDCAETGHAWEVVEVYRDDSTTLAVVRKCFECDLEFTEYEKIEDEEGEDNNN